jgi:hypothetical protein
MLVEKSNMRPLKLYVYNSVSEGCREVTIIPNKAWGGEGRWGTLQCVRSISSRIVLDAVWDTDICIAFREASTRQSLFVSPRVRVESDLPL